MTRSSKLHLLGSHVPHLGSNSEQTKGLATGVLLPPTRSRAARPMGAPAPSLALAVPCLVSVLSGGRSASAHELVTTTCVASHGRVSPRGVGSPHRGCRVWCRQPEGFGVNAASAQRPPCCTGHLAPQMPLFQQRRQQSPGALPLGVGVSSGQGRLPTSPPARLSQGLGVVSAILEPGSPPLGAQP